MNADDEAAAEAHMERARDDQALATEFGPEPPWTAEDSRREEEGNYADTLPEDDPGPGLDSGHGADPFDQDSQPGGSPHRPAPVDTVETYGGGHVYAFPRRTDPDPGGRGPATGGARHHPASDGRGREPGDAPPAREVLALRIVPAKALDLAQAEEWVAELTLGGDVIHRLRPLPYREALFHGAAVVEREAAMLLHKLREVLTSHGQAPDVNWRY